MAATVEASKEQQTRLQDLLKKYRAKGTFAYSLSELPGYTGDAPPFKLDLTAMPKKAGRRRHTPDELKFMFDICSEQSTAGIIEPGSSTDYNTESTFPRKKDLEGVWTALRHCLDLRAINDVTPFLAYPLPRSEELMDKFQKAKVFSKIDFRSGFHQIPLRMEDRDKTTFHWEGKPWRYTRMPFGLKMCVHTS